MEAEVMAEAMIRPPEPVTETIAVIEFQDSTSHIGISFPERRDDFAVVMKSFGMQWKTWKIGEVIHVSDFKTADEKRWQCAAPRNPTEFGSRMDLMADIGRALLANGFVISVVDHVVHGMIESGEYQSYRSKYVNYHSGQSVGLHWLRRDGDFYAAAKKIKGAKWTGVCVSVPITSADEVRDFAETAGFHITGPADRAMAAFDDFRANGMIVAVEKKTPEKVSFKLDKTNLADFRIDDEFLDEIA